MTIVHHQISLRTRGRGTHEITHHLRAAVKKSGVRNGLAIVFCRHTSCSLVIMENADPSARRDLETYFDRMVSDGDPSYEHTLEGPDDMSAHIRMALTRTSETVPIADGELLLGTWQGMFLFEHRTAPHNRQVVISILG